MNLEMVNNPEQNESGGDEPEDTLSGSCCRNGCLLENAEIREQEMYVFHGSTTAFRMLSISRMHYFQ